MPAAPQQTAVQSDQQPALPLLRAIPSRRLQGLAVVVCTYQRPASLSRFLESLAAQDRIPEQLIIVDASPGDETERLVGRYRSVERLARRVEYFRVAGPLMGLTRQRNFALRWVATDLVAFFDDDVVLLPRCLSEMERVHRSAGDQIIGVGALICNQSRLLASAPTWRVRRLFGMMRDLQPGRYHRSGLSTPWLVPAPTTEVIEGDWLPGCAMMWKTEVARAIGFCEEFSGYALGEDLDFSLRARRRGRLVVAGAARVLHLQEPTGRPSHFQWGYMAIYNKYQIHRRALADRTWRDVAWFVYTWTLDTLLLTRYLFLPGRRLAMLPQLAGRLKATYDILRGR